MSLIHRKNLRKEFKILNRRDGQGAFRFAFINVIPIGFITFVRRRLSRDPKTFPRSSAFVSSLLLIGFGKRREFLYWNRILIHGHKTATDPHRG